MQKTVFILGCNSDIGAFLSKKWLDDGCRVVGTYRKSNEKLRHLKGQGLEAVQVEFGSCISRETIIELTQRANNWDIFLSCIGSLQPLELFSEANIDDWTNAFDANFTHQVRVLHELLNITSVGSKNSRTILFLAGGAMNSATKFMSAYSIAKIALTKFVELCQFENPDDKFSIIGPGWINTKIHQQTLDAGHVTTEISELTIKRLKTGDFNSVEKLAQMIEWVISSPVEIVGGRNFSLSADNWADKNLIEALSEDSDLFKLRRKQMDGDVS
ncbi:SDR family oxidoreductase [Planktomarina temperata]|nr:SDR family oxidoreductase [Planktomarina temperata]